MKDFSSIRLFLGKHDQGADLGMMVSAITNLISLHSDGILRQALVSVRYLKEPAVLLDSRSLE